MRPDLNALNLSTECASLEAFGNNSSDGEGNSHFQLVEPDAAVQQLTTLSQRLAAASRNEQNAALRPLSDADEAEVNTAFERYEVGARLMNEPTADRLYVHALLTQARDVFAKFEETPPKLLAQVDLCRAITLMPTKDKRQLKQAQNYLEDAVPILRATSNNKTIAEVLSIQAYCEFMLNRGKARYERAGALTRESLLFLNKPKHRERRAQELTFLAACLHEKKTPDWPGAVQAVREAIDIFEALGKIDDLIRALRQLAWICQMQPNPDNEQATVAYEEALLLLAEPEHREKRADTLDRLAVCLYNRDEEHWERMAEAMREAVRLWREIDSPNHLRGVLDCAHLLEILEQPPYAEIAELYQEALQLLPPEAEETRAAFHFNLALSLEHLSEPDWTGAIASSRTAVELFCKVESRDGLIISLQQLTWLASSQEEPELDTAIASYRELLPMLTGPKQKSAHATALFNLAFCLHRQPEPDWEESYAASREAARLFRSLGNREGWTDAVRLTIYSCLHKEGHGTSEDIKNGKAILKHLQKPEQRAAHAEVLHRLSYLLYTQPPRRWSEAISFSKQAIELFREEGDTDELAEALGQLGAIYQTKPKPDYGQAIALFRESLGFLTAPEQRHRRGTTLYLLALTYFIRPVPQDNRKNWDAIAEVLTEAADIFREEISEEWQRQTLPILALALCAKTEPEWERAVERCREALPLLPTPEHAEERTRILQTLSAALHKQARPDWCAAIAASEELVELSRSQVLREDDVMENNENIKEAIERLSLIRERAANAAASDGQNL